MHSKYKNIKKKDKSINNSNDNTRLEIINKRKRTCRIVAFAAPADHRVRLKECEKKDNYLDLARKIEKLWNMKMTIILIVIGTLGSDSKWLIQGLENL